MVIIAYVSAQKEAEGMNAGIYVSNVNTTAPLTSQANHGIDVSSAISTDSATCLVSSYSFMVARGYHSSGSVDTNVCTSIKHASSAGFTKRDTYLFPCPTCSKSAATQVQELVDYLNANCASQWSKRVWLDIEGSQYWTGDTTKNRNWYQSLVDACKSKAKCGVYASASQWSAIFGSTSYKYGNDLPLWYAHYDGNANFDDFSSFGGWSSPHAKQYAGTTSTCSASVDKNYSPSF